MIGDNEGYPEDQKRYRTFYPELTETRKAIQAILSKLSMNEPDMVHVGKGYTLSRLISDLKAIGEGK